MADAGGADNPQRDVTHGFSRNIRNLSRDGTQSGNGRGHMAFHEVRLPARLAFGSTGGVERRTEITTLASGFERRRRHLIGARADLYARCGRGLSGGGRATADASAQRCAVVVY